MLLELGLRISEAVGANIDDPGEQGRHRVLHIKGKGQATKATPVPLNASVSDAVDRAAGGRANGPLLTTGTGARLTRQHAASSSPDSGSRSCVGRASQLSAANPAKYGNGRRRSAQAPVRTDRLSTAMANCCAAVSLPSCSVLTALIPRSAVLVV